MIKRIKQAFYGLSLLVLGILAYFAELTPTEKDDDILQRAIEEMQHSLDELDKVEGL